ncbi:nucleotide exchange factor GrpE [Candidatus Xianfuyuplasma coldseepsis]|uniref:Protein GrpE n=1 Tax=Candidatus Xianfuyuplasma coldseepsis TaxID=2782163 RepID=A0A7L7KVY7_9MOLU|nr:nucleotide exchange factor GrpE [Xianfuyuplasma coldseepsis]QMS85918.1 nucleotide exchange factor GrpE [Xianfuyuplasma coldseepsis]
MSRKKHETEVEQPEETVEQEEKRSIEEELSEQIAALTTELDQVRNDYLKEQADLINTKKRLEKERVTERKYAAMNVAKAFISPLDHFELALSHAPDDDRTKSFVQGFEMILKEIKKNLETVGVSEIDALDEDYDPNFHQAVMTEKVDDIEPNKVIEVLQKGYMFKDRVIRPAMVKISE